MFDITTTTIAYYNYRLQFTHSLVISVAAVLLVLITGRPLIGWLVRLPGMKWSAREDTPDTHLKKHGIPSMGGLGIIGAALTSYLVFCAITWRPVLVVYAPYSYYVEPVDFRELFMLLGIPMYTVAHLALGFRDDWLKAKCRGGLRARSKFALQCLLALGLVLVWQCPIFQLHAGMRTFLPHPSIWTVDPVGSAFRALAIIVLLVGTCNAVNITDGIDGLAAGLWVQCGIALSVAVIALSLWSVALAGACLGFLAFNKHPAKVFMGDTGSLALGAALAAAALFGHAILLLPFIAFIFYIELFSVAIQVLYFKYTRITRGEGVRLFRRAPLHHHFELAGWSEWRVVLTFWGVNLLTTMLGMVLWELGYIPRFP